MIDIGAQHHTCGLAQRLLRGTGLTMIGLTMIGLAGFGGAAWAQAPVSTAPAPQAPIAQTPPPPADAQVQEVVVTGIRGSLKRAIDVKRKSDVIVDSIASEDLGKFPDSNVAESLQRITGVSIDRSGGEGRFVTVRGFGPQFNTVLVNGRTMASEEPGRAFSFDLLAADLISGADVYKTTNATLQEGGIGSTINLHTARPFDIAGQKIVLSAKGNYEDLSGKSAPDVFGLYSNKFLDGRLGILASISYQERKTRIDEAVDDGYYVTDVGQKALGNFISGVNMPQDYNQFSDSEDRQRTGVTGTVQYKLFDNLTLTLDGLYNKYDVKSVANQVGHFFTPAGLSNVKLDSNNTVVAFDQDATGHTDFVSRTFNRPTETKAFGFNADWNPTSLINLKFDTSYSRAFDNNGGNEIFAVIGYNNPIHYDATSGGLPNLTSAKGFTAANSGLAHFATRQGSNFGEEVYETRLDGTFRTEYEHFTDIKIGAIYTDRTKTNQLIQSSSNVWCSYCGYAIPVPAGLLQPFSPSGFLSGDGGNFPRQWLSFNPEQYFTFLQSQAAANAQDVATGQPVGTTYANIQALGGYQAVPQPSSYNVREKVSGGYLQADFRGDIGGMRWSAVLGARYVHTDLTSNGTTQPLLDLKQVISGLNPDGSVKVDTTIYNVVLGNQTPVSGTKTYDDFLPTLNVKVEITPDMLARFGASQSVTRPNLTDVAPQLTFNTNRPGNLQASGGNPELQPYKSTNFDTSYEWYYQKAGFFTIDAFYKKLDNFIVSAIATESFTILNSDNLKNSDGTPTFPDNTAKYGVRRPRNIGSADVYGVEVGFQHTFDWLPAPFDGFGVTLNATFVDSNANTASTAGGPTFALEGLGNSQNAVLFYAKGPFEARVAYNHRDSFLSTQANAAGGDPIFTKSAGQVDMQATYAVTKNLSLIVEAIDVNDAKVQTYDSKLNQFISLIETGPRYSVGVRAQF